MQINYLRRKDFASSDRASGISGCVLNIPTLNIAAAGSSCGIKEKCLKVTKRYGDGKLVTSLQYIYFMVFTYLSIHISIFTVTNFVLD